MVHLYNIISDDDLFSTKLIERLNEFGNYKLLNHSNSIESSTNSILKDTPGIVFIDFENSNIQNHFGFVHELHLYLDEIPHFIGVSSDTSLAYKAIKNNFSEYLLKSASVLDLRKMMMKLYKRDSRPKLCVSSYSDHHYIQLGDILYLKADSSTTDFYLENSVKITAYKTLKYFENLLPKEFLRIHNSYIINTKKVSRINFGKKEIYLNRQRSCKVPFSKSHVQLIRDLHDSLIRNSFEI